VAAGFRTRRVKTDSSIGDKLKKARTRKKITISDVEESTRIRAKFILALESDSWEQIPGEAYGRGYLEAYAQFLGLSGDGIMKQYGRERELYARHCQGAGLELAPQNRVTIPRFLLTPRFFVYGSVGLFLLLGGGLAANQLREFSSAPFLELAAPSAHAESGSSTQLVVAADSINLSGRTAMGASVKINGKDVPVSEQGNFQGSVSLQKGSNAILVEAENTNGKKSSEIVNVVAQ